MKKRTYIGITALLFVVIAVAAGFYLRTNLARLAAPHVGRILNRQVRIGAIELDPLRSLRMYDVHVAALDGTPLASFSKAVVRYRLTDLLRKKFVIYGSRVEGLTADISRYGDGTMNIPFLDSVSTEPAAPADSGGFQFIFSGIDLADAHLTYRDTAAGGLAVELRHTDAALRLTRTGNYGITLHAAAGSVRVADIPLPVDGCAIVCDVGADGLDIDTLLLRTAGLLLDVRGTMGFADSTVPTDAAVLLRGRPGVLPAAVAALLPPALKLPDALTISVHAAGPVAGPRVDARITATNPAWDGIGIPLLEVRAGWEPGDLQVERAAATVWGGTVTLDGRLRDGTNGPDWEAGVSVADIGLRRVLRQDTDGYDGTVTAKGRFGGTGFTLQAITGRLEAAVRRVRLAGRSMDDMTLLADVRSGQASLGIFTPFATVDAVLPLDDVRGSGPFTVMVGDLGPVAAFAGVQDIGGRLEAAGTVSGLAGSPVITGVCNVTDVRWQGIPLDSAGASFSVKGNQWAVFDGYWRSVLDAVQLESVAGTGLSGTVVHSGTFEGGPEGFTAGFEADMDAPAYDTYAFDRGRISAGLKGDSITLNELVLGKNGITVRASGGVSLARQRGTVQLTAGRDGDEPGDLTASFDYGSLRAAVALAGFDLSLVPELVPGAPSVAGRADLRVEVYGPLDNPTATAALRVRSAMYDNGIFFDSVYADVSLKQGRAVLQRLAAGGTDGTVRVSGSAALRRRPGQVPVLDDTGVWQAEADVTVPALGAFTVFLPESLQAAGALAVHVRLEGTPRVPVLDGSARLTEGRISFGSAPPLEALELRAVLAGSTLTLDSLGFRVGTIPADLRGTVSYGGGPVHAGLTLRAYSGSAGPGTAVVTGTVDTAGIRDAEVRIDGLDLDVLAPFTAPAAVRGRADMDVRAAGPYTDPRIDGTLTLAGLEVRMDNAGIIFSDGALQVRFDRYAAVLDSLYGSLNRGRVSAGGRVSWKGDGPVTGEAVLTASDVTYTVPDMAVVNVASLDARYAHGPEPMLNADIVLGKTRITPRLGMPQVLALLKSSERPPDAPDPLLAALRLDARVRLGDDLWVDNNLARLRVEGDVTVTGTPLKPGVAGRVSAREGYVLYLDRKFTVDRATADFIDPVRINPVVDVAARCELKAYQTASKTPYTISLNVTGPADATRVELVSDPPLDKPDIVALLTLGRTRGALTGGGDAGNAVIDRLKEYSSSRVAGYTERKIGNLLGLESVSIQGDLFQFDKNWGPQLVASKKVTDRMEVTYSTTVGHSNDQSVKLRYRLSDSYALEGETDRQGRAGVDLKFRVPFK